MNNEKQPNKELVESEIQYNRFVFTLSAIAYLVITTTMFQTHLLKLAVTGGCKPFYLICLFVGWIMTEVVNKGKFVAFACQVGSGPRRAEWLRGNPTSSLITTVLKDAHI